MSDPARQAVIEAHCRELKLPTARRQYPELVRRDGAVARVLR